MLHNIAQTAAAIGPLARNQNVNDGDHLTGHVVGVFAAVARGVKGGVAVLVRCCSQACLQATRRQVNQRVMASPSPFPLKYRPAVISPVHWQEVRAAEWLSASAFLMAYCCHCKVTSSVIAFFFFSPALCVIVKGLD